MELKDYANTLKELGQARTVMDFYKELAGELGVHSSLVRMWAYKKARFTAEHVLPIERYTQGAVHRTEMRPDLYPPEEYKKKAR